MQVSHSCGLQSGSDSAQIAIHKREAPPCGGAFSVWLLVLLQRHSDPSSAPIKEKEEVRPIHSTVAHICTLASTNYSVNLRKELGIGRVGTCRCLLVAIWTRHRPLLAETFEPALRTSNTIARCAAVRDAQLATARPTGICGRRPVRLRHGIRCASRRMTPTPTSTCFRHAVGITVQSSFTRLTHQRTSSSGFVDSFKEQKELVACLRRQALSVLQFCKTKTALITRTTFV